jgi:hypothetical protein
MSEHTQDLIGKLLDARAQRDAIHIAVAPLVAAFPLHPGQHVGLTKDGQAAPRVDGAIGIVDPFLRSAVKAGDRFFIFLYPNTATGLRHVYTHPVLDSKEVADRAASEKWLREFAKEYFSGYDERTEEESYKELLQSAIEGDFCFNGQPDWLYEEGAQQKLEMWGHLEVVLGRPLSYAHKAGSNYRCSC